MLRATGTVVSLAKEFRDFATKGNVFDLAVGVIVGNEFGKIVNSLVKDVMMPVVSLAAGQVSVADWMYEVPSSLTHGEPVRIQYGNFLQTVISFLIVAFCVFMAVKGMTTLRRLALPPPPEPESEPPPPSPEVALLAEIRDLLKQNPDFAAADTFALPPENPFAPSDVPAGPGRDGTSA